MSESVDRSDLRFVGVQMPGVLLISQRHAPTQRAVALGARLADPQPDSRWSVLLDPAGHPFCITTLAPPPELLVI